MIADELYLMGFFKPVVEDDFKNFRAEKHLHVSVMPEFSLDKDKLDELQSFLKKQTAKIDPFEVSVIGKEEFAPNFTVSLVDVHNKNQSLQEVHSMFSEKLAQLGGLYAQPQFSGDGFNPHASFMETDSHEKIDTLTLVYHAGGFGKDVRIIGEYSLNH